MKYQRLLIGLVAGVFLTVGAVLYFFGSNPENISTGIAVRVGLLLGVIWLAMPQLEGLKSKISAMVWTGVLLILIVAAFRPRLFPVMAGVLAVGLALNWFLGWASRHTR